MRTLKANIRILLAITALGTLLGACGTAPGQPAPPGDEAPPTDTPPPSDEPAPPGDEAPPSDDPAPPPGDPDDRLDLQGLWLVIPGPGTAYGAGGTTTLEFGAEQSGSARFLSRSDANGITTCERHTYASLSESVVMVDGVFYEAEVDGADRMVLSSETGRLTLERLEQAVVDPCDEAEAIVLASFDFGLGSFTALNAVGQRLYFNSADAGEPLVSVNTASGAVGVPRDYTQSVLGGVHRWVVAARSDDLFYGHCGCGGSTSVDYYNLGSNLSVRAVDTLTEATLPDLSIRYGYFEGPAVVIGGRSREDRDVNLLLGLDVDTLALVSQREILEQADVQDLTLWQGELLALVDGYLVVVGENGMAQRTIKPTGRPGAVPRGLATVGETVYLLEESTAGSAVVYELDLP